MERLVIKNFGPINYADIEIKRILVLTGEQASGKSTIAKLIYFFKVIPEVLFAEFYTAQRDSYHITEDFKLPLRNKFYEFFGSTKHLPDFEIKFHYSQEKWIKLTLDSEKKLMTELSPNFIRNYPLKSIKRSLIQIDEKLIKLGTKRRDAESILEERTLGTERAKQTQALYNEINNIFLVKHTSSSFAVAGRESIISYEQVFEYILKDSLQESSSSTKPMVDESLMVSYLKECKKVKEEFKKFGGSFTDLYDEYKTTSSLRSLLDEKVTNTLKAKYMYDEWDEKLVYQDEQYVFLKNASSGQKETIRLLQDIVLCTIKPKESVLRVFEEPEAHLFPIAQKNLIELMIVMLNQNLANQLIITTHSPYILSVLNNLLFAHTVANQNDTVNERFPLEVQIASESFSAYSLGNSFNVQENYCESIVDIETSTIKQNYLDTVSDMLAEDFNYLYTTYAESTFS